MILRDRDTNADTTLDERVYYLQNWRADVVALVSDAAAQIEQVRYSAYGVPFNLPAGDVIAAYGQANFDDYSQIATWYGTSHYDPRGDLDLDGDVDATDIGLFVTNTNGGRTVLSSAADNRIGYAGYEADPDLTGSKWHVRHRVLLSGLGKWNRRDSLLMLFDTNLYEYVDSHAVRWKDPFGLIQGEGDDGGFADIDMGFIPESCLARPLGLPGLSENPPPVSPLGALFLQQIHLFGVHGPRAGFDSDSDWNQWKPLFDFLNGVGGQLPGFGLPSLGTSFLDGAPDWFKIEIAQMFTDYASDFSNEHPNENPDHDPRYVWLETWALWAGGNGNLKEVCCAVKCRNPNRPGLHGPRVDCTVCLTSVRNTTCCKRIDPTKSDTNPHGNPAWGPVTPNPPPGGADVVTRLAPYRPPI
ncbi:MAG: hypothetical protein R3B57_08155 [Phycisphaerales bacterium]